MDVSDASDPEREEFEHQEALLLVGVVRAQSAIRRYEKNLAQAQLDETMVLGTLYKCHITEMQRRFDMAESHLRSICNSIQMNGGILCEGSLLLHKHRRQSSASSISIDHDPQASMCFIKNHDVLNLTVSLHADRASPEV